MYDINYTLVEKEKHYGIITGMLSNMMYEGINECI